MIGIEYSRLFTVQEKIIVQEQHHQLKFALSKGSVDIYSLSRFNLMLCFVAPHQTGPIQGATITAAFCIAECQMGTLSKDGHLFMI